MEIVGILSLGTLGVIAAGYLAFKLGQRAANIEIDRRKSQEFREEVRSGLKNIQSNIATVLDRLPPVSARDGNPSG